MGIKSTMEWDTDSGNWQLLTYKIDHTFGHNILHTSMKGHMWTMWERIFIFMISESKVTYQGWIILVYWQGCNYYIT